MDISLKQLPINLGIYWQVFPATYTKKRVRESLNSAANMVRTRDSSSQDECPICMDPVKLGIETNCGHLFCSGCMINNWKTNFSTSPMPCPYCRQNVTILLPVFTEQENNTTDLSEVREREHQLRDIQQYNQMYSGIPRSVSTDYQLSPDSYYSHQMDLTPSHSYSQCYNNDHSRLQNRIQDSIISGLHYLLLS